MGSRILGLMDYRIGGLLGLRNLITLSILHSPFSTINCQFSTLNSSLRFAKFPPVSALPAGRDDIHIHLKQIVIVKPQFQFSTLNPIAIGSQLIMCFTMSFPKTKTIKVINITKPTI